MNENNKVPTQSKFCFLSIIAFVLAILIARAPGLLVALPDLCIVIALNIIILAMAIISLKRIENSSGRLRGKRFAMLAVAGGILNLIFVFFYLVSEI